MECSTNLPQAAFFSAEEKVQLISGNCPRHITKEISFKMLTTDIRVFVYRSVLSTQFHEPLCQQILV